jgi:sporulation protein YlmC with PRC-barrel domain
MTFVNYRVAMSGSSPTSQREREEKLMSKLVRAAIVSFTLAASPLALAQTSPSPPSTAPSTGSSAQPQWYSHQGGEMRASKLIGTSVKNSAGETIGDVNDVVLGKDGKVAAVVIGVGGFLGLGERQVAVKFESLGLNMGADQKTVATLNATKDSLSAAPEWKWSAEGRSGTTGTGTKPPRGQ